MWEHARNDAMYPGSQITPGAFTADAIVTIISSKSVSSVSKDQHDDCDNRENMLRAQKAVFSHAPPPASDRGSPRRTGTHLSNEDHNDAPQDKPAVQLHNSSSQSKLVECERVTRQQMSLNG
ncbi:hypothetical protein HBH68_179590 [Parastagonospora nodorum]|nr:hypothetical protein HBI09_080540 [Parastagonospora nodorum]KAH4218088.1 hypothetical protein HBI06_206200 [Parastagonospora nodorum]KAH4988263.1 hypothetical protein HBI76_087900 [Parastagonospora nodorum]KAH5092080.1 hypothetical protein HBH72_193470 [Parastagonospora nodorum]KAH5180830.1 hypothetical protein HBH68_179590 [Parastagonospora nodorum]